MAAAKTINIGRLKAFAEELLVEGGFTANEAKTIAESLALSELVGCSSHGVIRIKEYLDNLHRGIVLSGAQIQILKETSNSIAVDARMGAGQVVMPQILEKLYGKINAQAVVTAAVRMCGHIGRLGEWVERSANNGYPCVLFSNDNGTGFYVAPPGGKKAMVSTNPIAFAIPLPNGDAFVADMSTSAIANGKIGMARLNGDSIPPDCIQDADGNPTVDPDALLTDPPGSIMPMGGSQGYKGFALSMFIDMLVSGLSGGNVPPTAEGTKYANNFTMVLWNPQFFNGLEYMQNQALQYINFIRTCPPTDANKPIRIAGDKLKMLERERNNQDLSLSEHLVNDLIALAKKMNVMVPVELL